MKHAAKFVAALLFTGILSAPALAQRGRAVTPAPVPHPTIVAPPVVRSPPLNAPSIVVPSAPAPRLQEQRPIIVAPPPARAAGAGDGGGDDNDGDGYGRSNDCNDFDASVHPGAPEIANGRDDNCDGYSY